MKSSSSFAATWMKPENKWKSGAQKDKHSLSSLSSKADEEGAECGMWVPEAGMPGE